MSIFWESYVITMQLFSLVHRKCKPFLVPLLSQAFLNIGKEINTCQGASALNQEWADWGVVVPVLQSEVISRLGSITLSAFILILVA